MLAVSFYIAFALALRHLVVDDIALDVLASDIEFVKIVFHLESQFDQLRLRFSGTFEVTWVTTFNAALVFVD